MLSTFIDYKTKITDLSKTLHRTASQPETKREIQYFTDHIGKVKTLDDFMADHRLYTFAMKAYGLEDMIPSKGFMKKVLSGQPDVNGHVLADRLQDERYRDFAAAFNFKGYGQDPSIPQHSDDPDIQSMIDAAGVNKTPLERRFAYDNDTISQIDYIRTMQPYMSSIDDIVGDWKVSSFVRTAVGLPPANPEDDKFTQAEQIKSKFNAEAFQDGEGFRQLIDQFTAERLKGRKSVVDPYFRPAGLYADSDAEISKLTQYFQAKMSAVNSAKDIASDPVLFGVVVSTLGLSTATAKGLEAQTKLVASKLDVASLRDPRKLSQFLDRFTSQRSEARTATVDAYIRQTLETDSGNENEGVRLALYFQRKAPSVRSAYGLLADPALAQVVRTALGLPPEAAKGSVEAQAKLIQRKLDISSLRDPQKLDQFIKRFTNMWDVQNNPPSTPALALFNSTNSGLDSDMLLKLQSIRLGGR
ncbi:DUF1217 domain-containing protein [Methylobacterium brachiatum]|uniref:DUF1217 domain-containing protein n=1 Tax=Methylobacterium brachiatum TaxID=269660 RepID=UPI0008F3B94D|nr:DUF1217 domain-containing protein [Methylobacterium brachiatum]SFJ51709.1 Protein of unknown function [Methylobacterium brachiatum]